MNNLTGKSNFMDAISFVMGEKTNCLRVKRLSELIHGAAIGRPVSNRCFVTAKFELPDGTKIDFQRSVIGSSADYKINGKVNELFLYRECGQFLFQKPVLIKMIYIVGRSKRNIFGGIGKIGHQCEGKEFSCIPRCC